MLQKHLQKFAQWEQLFQELFSCNTCSSLQKDQKKGRRGGQNKQILPSLSTKHPKTFMHIKQSMLFRTHPWASLSLHNDHRFDGRQCAQTPFPSSNQRSTTKEGGKKFFFVQIFLFQRSFSLLRKKNNRTLFFYFRLFNFHKQTFIKQLLFLERHFLVSFSCFFPEFFGFCGQRHLFFVLYECFYLFRKKPCFFRTTSHIEPALSNRII